MFSNIKFAISSHINYIDKTKTKIINSLINAGINKKDIYIFVGGDNVSNNYRLIDHNTYSVPHNSIDFNGLISILDLNIESPFWFLLHDTCYAGYSFYQKILSYPYQNKTCVSLTNDGKSMNMGLYSWLYLQSKKNEILSFKNIDYTTHGLNRHKQRLIDHEDIFLNKQYAFNNSLRRIQNAYDYYGTGIFRTIEYFLDIDFYKVKANNQIKPVYTMEP